MINDFGPSLTGTVTSRPFEMMIAPPKITSLGLVFHSANLYRTKPLKTLVILRIKKT